MCLSSPFLFPLSLFLVHPLFEGFVAFLSITDTLMHIMNAHFFLFRLMLGCL